MVYRGLSLVPRIANGLNQLLAENGYERLDQAIGTATQDWL
jgi:dihydroorotate dehydrogenase